MTKKPAGDELVPLRVMCREGRLFDVQQWVREGNPVALKVLPPRRHRRNSPICIAIDRGFHSLVQVLLEAGAPMNEGDYRALRHAVEVRRKDLVLLLINHGAKVQDVSMQTVLATWDREMVDLFVAHGASLVKDLPIAWALTGKIRTALGVFKKYVRQQPQLIEQVEIALRYHAREGHTKWVSLMLWAGADPWSEGPDEAPDYDMRPYNNGETPPCFSAVELAISRKQLEVLSLKNFLKPPDPQRPETAESLRDPWLLRDRMVVKLLLERGYMPMLYEDLGSAVISRLLCELCSTWSTGGYYGYRKRQTHDIDTYESAEKLEIVGMLLAHGAKWKPKSAEEIKGVRNSLLKMAPKYMFEFVEMVHLHKSARRLDMWELIHTPSMAKLLAKRCRKIPALVAELPDELP